MDPLPDWLIPLPDADMMRGIDRWAIEQQGIPGIELMERAGLGLARVVERIAPDGPVTVVCGKGNNGGDGLVLTRLLRDHDRPARVVCATPPEELSGDAGSSLARLSGPPPVRLDGSPWEQPGAAGADHGDPFAGTALVVDALLGTGFQGEPRGAIAAAIAAINAAGAPVLSVDVPSGVDASCGAVTGEAVAARCTVSFHAAKPGLWIRPGKAQAGEVEVLDIGIPRGAPVDADVGLIGGGVLGQLPRRGAEGTKFSSGHVLVVGGSRGLTGAPTMAARASLRAGAGYVTACLPASLQAILAASTVEVMTIGLPDRDGALTSGGKGEVLAASARGGALVLGPGLGRSENAFELARTLAGAAEVPLVLDADGLNAHAGRLDRLAGRGAATVLTPHAGELGRLLELDSAEIEARRLEHVRAAARRADAVVVLKGDDTLVADPLGRVAVSPGGAPGLATAGTGDVLSGVIGALLAHGLDGFTAAAGGVLLHLLAGREAARRVGGAEGVIATDVIAALPAVRVPAVDPKAAFEGVEGDG